MIKKKFPIFSVTLFVLAGLLIIYSGWAFINCSNYIAEAMASGQLASSGSEFDIVNFYMANCAQYVIFAILFVAVGRLLCKPSVMIREVPVKSTASAPQEKDNKDDDLDEWFEEMQQNKDDQCGDQ